MLAILLTYVGICVQYVPDIVKAISEQGPDNQPVTTATPVADGVGPSGELASGGSPDKPEPAPGSLKALLLALGFLLAFALAAPFLGGFHNIMGILIIGFALWEAWKMNRRLPLQIEGPLRVAAPSPTVSP